MSPARKTPPTCPHTKSQAGFAYMCARCREEASFLASLDKQLNAEIDAPKLTEFYDLKEKP